MLCTQQPAFDEKAGGSYLRARVKYMGRGDQEKEAPIFSVEMGCIGSRPSKYGF